MISEDAQIKICQQEIIRLDLQIKALIQDIRDCEGPLGVLQDFNQDVREKILELKGRIKELETLANEQDRETDRITLLKDAEKHQEQLASTQISLRKANLTSQLALEKREKDSLFTGESSVRQRPQSSKDGVAKTASNITDSLSSLSRTMAEQVKAQESTLHTLAKSSGTVGETHEEFKNMTGHIQNSRKILTRYSRREFTDKLLIFIALVFFFATVLYIVKKRMFGAAGVLEAATGFTGSSTGSTAAGSGGKAEL